MAISGASKKSKRATAEEKREFEAAAEAPVAASQAPQDAPVYDDAAQARAVPKRAPAEPAAPPVAQQEASPRVRGVATHRTTCQVVYGSGKMAKPNTLVTLDDADARSLELQGAVERL